MFKTSKTVKEHKEIMTANGGLGSVNKVSQLAGILVSELNKEFKKSSKWDDQESHILVQRIYLLTIFEKIINTCYYNSKSSLPRTKIKVNTCTEPMLDNRFRADVKATIGNQVLYFEIAVRHQDVPKEKVVFCENHNAILIKLDFSDYETAKPISKQDLIHRLNLVTHRRILVNPNEGFTLKDGTEISSFKVIEDLSEGLVVRLMEKTQRDVYLAVSYQEFPDSYLSKYVSNLRREEQKPIYTITIRENESWVDHIKEHQMNPV